MNTQTAPLPITFYRYRKDGSPNPDIKRAFLQTLVLTAEDAIAGRLWLEDKSEWILVLEQPVREALRNQSSCAVICSFQLRIQGAYAVARLNAKAAVQTHTNTDMGDNDESC